MKAEPPRKALKTTPYTAVEAEDEINSLIQKVAGIGTYIFIIIGIFLAIVSIIYVLIKEINVK